MTDELKRCLASLYIAVDEQVAADAGRIVREAITHAREDGARDMRERAAREARAMGDGEEGALLAELIACRIEALAMLEATP